MSLSRSDIVAQLREMVLAAPTADVVADYAILRADDQALRPFVQGGDPAAMTSLLKSADPDVARTVGPGLARSAGRRLLAHWAAAGDANTPIPDRLTSMRGIAERASTPPPRRLRIAKAIGARIVDWGLLKWAAAGVGAFVAARLFAPAHLVASASIVEVWTEDEAIGDEASKLRDALGQLWTSKMAIDTLRDVPAWCQGELMSGKPTAICASVALGRTVQIARQERMESSRACALATQVKSWNGFTGSLSDTEGGAIVGSARVLFDTDFVTSHLWGQPAGVVVADGGLLAERRKRAGAAVREYLALLAFVNKNACAAAEALNAAIAKAQVPGTQPKRPKHCALKLHVQNTGSSETTLDLDQVTLDRGEKKPPAATFAQVDETTGRLSSGPTGKVHIGSFADVTLTVDLKGCDSHASLLLPYSGRTPWSVLSVDLAPIAIPPSSAEEQALTGDCEPRLLVCPL